MKRIFILCLFLGFNLCLQAEDTIQGFIESGTWTVASSPYHIMDDVELWGNKILRIEPGVEIVFHGHYHIRAHESTIIAEGKPDSMILFTMADTTGLVNGPDTIGGWKGIQFAYPSDSDDTSKLEYCIFEYAKKRDVVAGSSGVIGAIKVPSLIIRQCVFRYNHSSVNGVDCETSDAVISNNQFHNNIGSYILTAFASNPIFSRNEIRDNILNIIFETRGWTFPVIENNLVKNNETGCILKADQDRSTPSFRNNKVLNNIITGTNPGSLFFLRESEAIIYNNLVANNKGKQISIYFGNNRLINNTFVNNDCNGNELLWFRTNNGEFNGNIFYGNSGQITHYKLDTEPSFINNIIEGGLSIFTGDPFTGIYLRNMDTDPDFVDPTSSAGPGEDAEIADFSLKITSPAINNGDTAVTDNVLPANVTDVYGNDRLKYGRIDMGAIEFRTQSVDFAGGTITSDTSIFGDTINVLSDIIVGEGSTLNIAPGSALVFNGPYFINIEGRMIAHGTETDSILFTVSDTTGFYITDQVDGSWGGIYMHDAGVLDKDEDLSLKYCILEFGKRTADENAGYDRGLIASFYNTFSAENCVFRNCFAEDEVYGGAIDAWNSDFSLESCHIYNNYNVAVYVRNSNADLSGCLLNYNTAFMEPSCLMVEYSVLNSTGNCYANNSFLFSMGQVVWALQSECFFMNDIIANNTSKSSGVLLFHSSDVTITNSNIVNNNGEKNLIDAAILLENTELDMYSSIMTANRGFDEPRNIFLFDDGSDPNIYYSLIEGGESSINTYQGMNYEGDFINCIDTVPLFLNPTVQNGIEEDASLADWQLYDISPCINAGTSDTTGLSLPQTDHAGNPRIRNERIDIGAFEKDGSVATISSDPQGAILCNGDDHLLEVEYSGTDSVLIQWKKDGIELAGATETALQLSDITQDDMGNYTCFLTNSFGTVYSLPVFLNVKLSPNIILEPDVSWTSPYETVNYSVFAEGTSPITYQWQKDNRDIPGETLPVLEFVPSDSSFEGRYTCIVSNICGTDTTTPGNLFLTPQICMVTVNPATGNNMVIWEKKSKAPLVAYNVYRESAAAGIYNFMETISLDGLSIYEDTAAIPTVQAYLYKITGVDTSGTETEIDLCRHHKTIHLLVSTNPELNSTQLDWDQYYGFDHLTSYIYRSSSGQEFEQVHSMSSALHSWIDPDPLDGIGYYRVAVVKPEPCVPTASTKKAAQETFSLSLSNVENNEIVSTRFQSLDPPGMENSNLQLFPNPVNESINIRFNNPDHRKYKLMVMNLSGSVIRVIEDISSPEVSLDRGDMSPGVYIIELRGQGVLRGKLIVE